MVNAQQDSAHDAQLWVEANRQLVDETYQRFLTSGEWPAVSDLQRHFDRTGLSVEVQDVADSKPRVINESRLPHAERLTLELRHLMWIGNAQPIVNICRRAVQRSVEAYLSDTDEPPRVTSEDGLTDFPFDPHGRIRGRAYQVLIRENPAPFAGSNMTDEGWWIRVDSRFARRFRGVTSIQDYIACQDVIRAEIATEAASIAQTYPGGDFKGTVLDVETATPWTASLPRPEPEIHPQLFLSWSRATSRAIAEVLRPMLDARLLGVTVFFSPTSIEPGDDPSRRMFDEGLLASSALLVVLTAHSATSPYVIWETATAWARDDLVIPLFVHIDPQAIPGPLRERVQGVHLVDRRDVDRGVERLSAHFGLADPSPLTDAEYEELLEAAQVQDEVGDRQADPSAPTLRGQLRGFVAEWQAAAAGLDEGYNPDDWKRLASQIRDVSLRFVRAFRTYHPDDPLGQALGEIAQEATKVTQIQLLLDGGMSFRAVADGTWALISAVETALTA